MKQNYFALALSIFWVLIMNGQTPFVHVSASKLNPEATSYYGTSLKDFQEKELTTSSKMINYHSVIPFNGVDDYLEIDKSISNLSQVTVFTVFKSENSLTSEAEVWGVQGEESNLGLTTKRAFNSDKQTYYQGAENNQAILHTYLQLHRTKNPQQNPRTFLNLGVTLKDSANTYFKGGIAELIAYKRRLRGKTRQKIETALALKYGITLTSGDNYISSNKKVVWDSEEDSNYTHNIIGIGRDDEMDLYQKQSTSVNGEEFMVLSATKKANSNKENTSVFEDRNFLVIGDNKGTLKGKEIEELTLTNRHWMLKSTGAKARNISTELQIQVSKMFDKQYNQEDYVLVIDSEGTGEFTSENNQYIVATTLSPEGILTFSDLKWDADKSGKDVFALAIKKSLEVTLSNENPEVCPEGITSLQYESKGGIKPYSYTLKSNNVVVREWNSLEDETLENNLQEIGKGNYTLEVKDRLGNTVKATYAITEQEAVTVDLGADKILKFEQSLPLNAQISNTDVITAYEWTDENGDVLSTEANFQVDKPGVYSLKITTNTGCSYSDDVLVDNSYIRAFTFYPNPTKDGKYSIDVEIAERANMEVQVFNSVGRLLDVYTVKNKYKTTIKGKILKVTGMYEVVLKTPQETVVKKLIVE